MSLISQVVTRSAHLPSRIFFYAAEKWGKTSFACFAPKPIFIMTQGETGLLTLLESGQVPETAHFPQACETWSDLQLCTRSVLTDRHDFQTLVIDTSNGAERLLASQVLEQEFNGQHAGKMGYGSYGKGDQACIPHWMLFLKLLDEIRLKRRMHIILLAHSRIKSVNNPEGDDYDQLRPEGIDKLWTLTHKWADVIAAGTLKIVVKDDKVQGSVTQRIIRTASTPAVVAGNRYGLSPVIDCGPSAQSAWANFQGAMNRARKMPTCAEKSVGTSTIKEDQPVIVEEPRHPSEAEVEQLLSNPNEFKAALVRSGQSWEEIVNRVNRQFQAEYDKAKPFTSYEPQQKRWVASVILQRQPRD